MLDKNELISGITTTPLLLTLFAITYRATQFKPESISEFYSIIFPTMLYRHDRMKLGFERKRESELSDYQMERLFEVLSFVSLKDGQVRFSTSKFRDYIRVSLQHEGIVRPIEDQLIQDLTLITALVIRDGYESYAYTHKSIQEYFAAALITRLSDEAKSTLFSQLISDIVAYRKWSNVVAFLAQIDNYNYLRFFLLPIRRNAIGLNDQNKITLTYSVLTREIGSETKAVVNEDGEIYEIHWDDTLSSSTFPSFTKFLRRELESYLKQNMAIIADYLAFCKVDDYERFRLQNGEFGVYVLKFISNTHLTKDVTKFLAERIEAGVVMKEIRSLEDRIKMTESLSRSLAVL